MKIISTEILVIGGGATGTGILRDLALRNFKAILVEKGDLSHGTTGRYHGLLHSGGRYVVRDPQAARECIEENRILRRIMPHCIEDTGGVFVLTPWDDPGYAEKFLAGCENTGVPVEEISVAQMLKEEPRLNPRITRCFRVPDASADSFLAAEVNVEAARQYGGQVLTYHPVQNLLIEGNRVVGARCFNREVGEEVEIRADLVINAAGAWAGKIAASAGIQVQISPGKGVMIAANHRLVHTVINRCKMPADGDILVPAHTVAIIGTTDVKIVDPDQISIEPWEIHLMLTEGDKLVPGFRHMRLLRAWAGVRPLYQETQVSDTRDVTRAFVLLDHEKRDSVSGLITITSGKWTTYRKMAEVTVDLVCQKLGTYRPCRTHLEPLPGAQHGYHALGARLAQVEQKQTYGQLICECELATIADVLDAIRQKGAKTIDDIRRDTRLGMGPCQGGFCTYRAAGIFHKERHLAAEIANQAVWDFLLERWKGLQPILWGQQLRQERLDQLIYLSLLNASHLPLPSPAGADFTSALGPEKYAPPEKPEAPALPGAAVINRTIQPARTSQKAIPDGNLTRKAAQPGALDVVIIGAGLAGLVAGWQLSNRGKRVRVIAKGWGSQYWHAGCIDVLGYLPSEGNFEAPGQDQVKHLPAESRLGMPADDLLVLSPSAGIERLKTYAEPQHHHPYLRAGQPVILEALQAFQDLCEQYDYPMHGDIHHNWLLPSALGVPRPTCLAPETMIAGDMRSKAPILVIGFRCYHDFYPEWIAANLRIFGIPAYAAEINLPGLKSQRFITSRVLAEHFEPPAGNPNPDFMKGLIQALKAQVSEFKPERLGLPAVLGFMKARQIKAELEATLGIPIFEIPTLPPSIPGIRLNRLLVQSIKAAGGQVHEGLQVAGMQVEKTLNGQSRLTGVYSEAAARRRLHRAGNFVIATGGILGGGLLAEVEPIDGSASPGAGQERQPDHPHPAWATTIQETACDLPVPIPFDHQEWLHPAFLAYTPHPIFRIGIPVNQQFNPLDPDGKVAFDNLYAIGSVLTGFDPLQERSLEGIALVTGYALRGVLA